MGTWQRRIATALVALATLAFAAACASYTAIPPLPVAYDAPELYQPPIEEEYRFQVGDQLTVRSYSQPQLDQEARVRPDGCISLVLLGDVPVAGRTATELNEALTAAYGRHVSEPEMTVGLKESSGANVYLGGELRIPSMHAIAGPLTLVQAVTLGGGFLPSADREHVLLLRRTQQPGGFSVFRVNVKDILQGAQPDVFLRRFDVVYVPKTSIAEVDEFVDQYINQVVPRAVLTNFGYTFVHNVNPSVSIGP